jgi:hypothetical protein
MELIKKVTVWLYCRGWLTADMTARLFTWFDLKNR